MAKREEYSFINVLCLWALLLFMETWFPHWKKTSISQNLGLLLKFQVNNLKLGLALLTDLKCQENNSRLTPIKSFEILCYWLLFEKIKQHFNLWKAKYSLISFEDLVVILCVTDTSFHSYGTQLESFISVWTIEDIHTFFKHLSSFWAAGGWSLSLTPTPERRGTHQKCDAWY